jgi:hypothetical protein
MPALKDVDLDAYRLYRDRLIADAGNPTDPIVVMILEQLAFAHLNAGLLQATAMNSATIEAVTVFGNAAARLLAEFRRSALALQAYRAASRQLANDPSRDIVLPVEQADPVTLEEKSIAAEKEASRESCDAEDTIIPYPGPAAVGDQPSQPPEVARIHARRSRKGPRRDPEDPAVGANNRAAHA